MIVMSPAVSISAVSYLRPLVVAVTETRQGSLK